jgi:hypothetical protein
MDNQPMLISVEVHLKSVAGHSVRNQLHQTPQTAAKPYCHTSKDILKVEKT